MTTKPTILIIEHDDEIAPLYAKEIELRGRARVELLLDTAEMFTPERLRLRLEHASIVVLDIAMKLPAGVADDGNDGGLSAGCKIHKYIKSDFPDLQVVCLTNLSQEYFDAATKRHGSPSAKAHSKFDMPPAALAEFLETLLP